MSNFADLGRFLLI